VAEPAREALPAEPSTVASITATPEPETIEASTPPATSTPSPAREAKPRTYSGTGAKVIRVKVTEPMLVQSVHRGQSNFTVYGISPDGEEDDLLANAVGNHRGTRIMNLFDGSETAGLKVDGDGSWKVTLKPLSQARRWGLKAARGHGDDVLALQPTSSGFQTIKAVHSGESNFTVHGYSDEGENLLVNQIGESTAEDTLPDGTFLVRVEGDGTWTLTRTS
jgi:hypothetical protein